MTPGAINPESAYTRRRVERGKREWQTRSVVFVAFAIEDERQRDFLKGQTLVAACPFEYIDMSVKEAYDTAWKERVKSRIRRSDGVIALVSKNSLTSTGQEWELNCARDEKKKILGIWAYTDDRTTLRGRRQLHGLGMQLRTSSTVYSVPNTNAQRPLARASFRLENTPTRSPIFKTLERRQNC
jgi:hypothetical protein